MRSKTKEFLSLFVSFGFLQLKSVIFAGGFFALLLLSNHFTFGLARYDFLFLGAIIIQVILLLTKLETKDELKVIMVFHVIGMILELFKTNPKIGSWSYPEDAVFALGTVPLYSGFMYSAVASYIIQSWRNFQLKVGNYPSYQSTIILSLLAYLNFFTHHYILDMRWWLIIFTFILFSKTKVGYTIKQKTFQMPLVVAFFLIALFIWIAENIATYLGAWKYSYQVDGWELVDFGKITSWFLLFILSFVIVADLRLHKDKKLAKLES